MGAASGGSRGRLPSGFAECEFLQGTGTQYIISDVVPRNTKTEADFQFGDIPSNTDGIVTSRYDTGNQRYYTLFKTSVNTLRFVSRDNNNAWQTPFDTGRHTFVFNDSAHGAYFDGLLKNTKATFACTAGDRPLGIFCRNSTHGAEAISPVKIYSLKFTDNDTDTVIGEYVPCVKTSTGEAGMYDLIGHKFYGNDGTGDFIAGPSV